MEGEPTVSRGRASARSNVSRRQTAQEWRDLAAAEGLSLREVVIRGSARQNFVGSASTIATTINDYVQADASDGFILVPHITPDGLDGFVEDVVPILQELGVHRTEYTGSTLRDNLGLTIPARDEADGPAARSA